MDKVQKVYEALKEFIQIFMIKYEYENRGILKKMKIDNRLNLELDHEKWCHLFLYKSCLNQCVKIIFLRYMEDHQLCFSKLNLMGIKRWKELVENLGDRLEILYDIAIKDLQADEDETIQEIFSQSDYDIFKIDHELALLIDEKLSKINFSEWNKEDLIYLFTKVYSLEEREEMTLNGFYKKAPAFSYMLRMDEKERKNVLRVDY